MIRRDIHPLFRVCTPLIAAVPLAGRSIGDIDGRAMREIDLFEKECVNGMVVSNYNGDEADIERVLRHIKKRGTSLAVGVDLFVSKPERAFSVAQRYDADFIQLTSAAGTSSFGPNAYDIVRGRYQDIAVLGDLSPGDDLREGVLRTDALVIDGGSTETPLARIREYRGVIGGHPLFVSDLRFDKAYEQMRLADGAIVREGIRVDGRAENEVELSKLRDYIAVFNEVRKEKRKREPASDAPIIVQ